MMKINSDESKKLMLEILKFIDQICKENNIKYSLAAGTLLGAYRHGGFIPWDDDIDIAMEREYYDKFIEVMNNNKNEDFKLLYKSTVKDYPYEFAKVIMNGTSINVNETGTNINMESGLFVDIFALDYYNKSLSRNKRKSIRQFETARRDVVIKRIYSKPLKVIFNLFKYISRIFVPINLIDRVHSKYVVDDSELVGYAIEHGHELLCKKNDYFPLRTIKFENHIFSCPNNVEKVLEAEYGLDYMTPPTEKNRIQHSISASINEEVSQKYNIYV